MDKSPSAEREVLLGLHPIEMCNDMKRHPKEERLGGLPTSVPASEPNSNVTRNSPLNWIRQQMQYDD